MTNAKLMLSASLIVFFTGMAHAEQVVEMQGQNPVQEMQGQNPAPEADDSVTVKAIKMLPLKMRSRVDTIALAQSYLNGDAQSVKWLYINLPALRDRAALHGIQQVAGKYRVSEMSPGVYEIRPADHATSAQLNDQPQAFLSASLRAAAPYIPESDTCAVYKPVELKRNADATTYKAITLECRPAYTAQVPATEADPYDYQSALLYPAD